MTINLKPEDEKLIREQIERGFMQLERAESLTKEESPCQLETKKAARALSSGLRERLFDLATGGRRPVQILAKHSVTARTPPPEAPPIKPTRQQGAEFLKPTARGRPAPFDHWFVFQLTRSASPAGHTIRQITFIPLPPR